MPSQNHQLIVALDHCTEERAVRLISELRSVGVTWFKVGLELFTLAGPAIIRRIKSGGLKAFLDLKLYDIPNTVAQAVKASADAGADLLTIHCSGGARMLDAAQQAAQGTNLSLLAVTVLTSFGHEDFPGIAEAWGARSGSSIPRGAVSLRLAKLAAAHGLPGIVCSVSDLHDGQLQALPWRHECPFLVTPGIRNADDALNDQNSVATVEQAIQAGSTHSVVGRPITASQNPGTAAQRFLKQIQQACGGTHGVTAHP